jgi:class 3 adenylate cyclase
MQEHLEQKKLTGQEVFEIRIGIHTGPVVAGIVGHKKFAYDIWGDAVNLASRMESSGEAGQINISQATYERINSVYSCTFRGEIDAKNKGKVGMYFVNIPSN